MSKNPTRLSKQIHELDPELRARLDHAGFDVNLLLSWSQRIASHSGADAASQNRIVGSVRAPRAGEISDLAPRDSDNARRLCAIGDDALRAGELAFCVLSGGMATRMGGVVKALAEALAGHTFLELRLNENRAVGDAAGHAVPLWLMTSDATDAPIRAALRELAAPPYVACFTQNLSLRLAPDGTLFRDRDGRPSTYSTGHGDFVDALARSGLVDEFHTKGGKYIWVANIDNLGATVDPALLGLFIESGKDLTVEVCDKHPGDRGGIPVHTSGKLQIVETFRLPEGFDPDEVGVFNTNTFLLRAGALRRRFDWTYFKVEKQVDGKPAIQFERLLQELTATLDTLYCHVPRDGAAARFVPVKDMAELSARQSEVRAVAEARGMLPHR